VRQGHWSSGRSLLELNICASLGKATLFVAKQDDLDTPDKDQMKELQAELNHLKEKLREEHERVKLGLEKELSALRNEPTDDQLEEGIERAEAEVFR